jgi:hypothetical protein
MCWRFYWIPVSGFCWGLVLQALRQEGQEEWIQGALLATIRLAEYAG